MTVAVPYQDADICMEGDHAVTAPISTLTLPQVFQHAAARFPDRAALTCAKALDSPDVHRLTYKQTLHKVTAVARALQVQFPAYNPCHATAAPFVFGILLDKSMELTLAILATTFSGATWLPFDPDAPAERIAICLGDAGAAGLIFDDAHASTARAALATLPLCAPLLYASLDTHATTTHAGHPLLWTPTPETAAYYIYTSGTTGTPKGISISHRAAVLFAYSESGCMGLTERDVVWNGFSPAFDMWVEETWCGFARGCELAVALGGQWRDIANLCHVWTARRVSVIMAVPTLMAMVCNEGAVPDGVRLINLGGEACPPALVSRLHRPNLVIFNTYGPSETTVTATYTIVRPDKPVTIGKPLPNYHALVLKECEDDETLVLPLALTEGVSGELAIGGPCVGQGYVGRPDLTAKKFVPHPTRAGEIIYRSGDLVSLNRDGEIVFIGRIDTQVKYRGFRIELGEIEDKLCSQPGVLAAAVILAKGDDDDSAERAIPTRLEAYVVMAHEAPMDVASLRKGLASTLMSYMMPDVYFQLAEHDMPRLLSGKINKKGLVSLSNANRIQEKAAMQNAPTRQAAKVETSLDFILEVLHNLFPTNNTITADSDFFNDLGGHSLLVATFASNLRKGHANFAENPFKLIGLADVYMLKTARKLSEKFTVQTNATVAEAAHRDFHSVSNARYVLCGLIQLPLLLFIFGLNFISMAGPWILSQYMYRAYDTIAVSLLTLYLSFVASPFFYAILALAAKWLLLGKVRPGDYPLFGWFYIRWWFVTRLNDYVDKTMWSDTHLNVLWLQLLGATIGQHTHIGSTSLVCADLISIGDGVTISHQVILGCEVVDQGWLKLRRITIGNYAYIGTTVTLEGDVHVQEGAELSAMTGVPEGTTIPAGQAWAGSPAKFQAAVTPWKLRHVPSSIKRHGIFFLQLVIQWFIQPAVLLVPLLPVQAFYAVAITNEGRLVNTIILSTFVGIAYVLLLIFILFFFKWVVLGRVREGVYSTVSLFFVRKWWFDGLMNTSLRSLHTLYATLYVVPFLRLLGAKIGARSEVSTARHVVLDLLEVEEECFVADHVLLGDDYLRGYSLKLERTKMCARSFTGNGCLVPQGNTIASNTLIGVFSKPPENPPLQDGESCFGLPAILMPTRRNVTNDYDASLLFNPPARLRALRLLVEGIRIFYPSMTITLGVGFAMTWILYFHPQLDDKTLAEASHAIGILVLLAPAYMLLFFVVPTILLTVVLKWILVGTYKAVEWPMWSLSVWLSEFITTIIEHLAPLAYIPFVGTPFLPMIYRLYGAKIGARCYMGVLDVPEFDCVHIGDDCAFNATSFPQTHLFEDRVMKLGDVHVGHRCTMRLNGTLLPQSQMQDDAALGCNSVAMKGESLSSGYEWYGFPVDIRKPTPHTSKEGNELINRHQRVLSIDDKDIATPGYTGLSSSRLSHKL
ncbi:Aste57867_21353 [Aphanomyces stellatus]|uniref:Aste57867_21353 protein n=1 Tax=Aphanomyces stellatus TaxID=120398 RepID=A0A485LH89_9STRA|nr:hypothetical protein As57867_021284 [Aphanomyces stellatus]VFT98025.1 Aste57867_21353 [Aphanomyces stellatus]